MSELIVPVILAGGQGTRLWPMSRSARPKQFLALRPYALRQQPRSQRQYRLQLAHILLIATEN